MRRTKDIDHLIENYVAEERETAFNPFLPTRIMAAIESKQRERLVAFSPVWRTAFVAAGLFVAVFTGIAAGSLYQSKGDAANIVLMNDSSMENFALYNQIGNE